MAFVPGVSYDVFIGYAHVDNLEVYPVLEQDRIWELAGLLKTGSPSP